MIEFEVKSKKQYISVRISTTSSYNPLKTITRRLTNLITVRTMTTT